jgi:ATP-binding protein involved in chromosome partitioning
VIAVGSGKGGVGKSTVALNIAIALAEAGESVGILDADVYAPDIPRMVDLKRKDDAPAQHWSLASTKKQQLEPVEAYGLKIMSTGFIVTDDHPMSWASALVGRLLWQFMYDTLWGSLDYLFVDLPPGTADLQQNVAKLGLTGALIVVTPQDVAHLDAKKLVSMYRAAGVPIVGGIENMSGIACPHCKERIELFPRVREERSIWAMGVDKLAEIPMDPPVAFGGDSGKPVLVEEPGSPAAHAFRDAAAAIARAISA